MERPHTWRAAVTFNEALSQTMAMLQQHGRVSYRALTCLCSPSSTLREVRIFTTRRVVGKCDATVLGDLLQFGKTRWCAER